MLQTSQTTVAIAIARLTPKHVTPYASQAYPLFYLRQGRGAGFGLLFSRFLRKSNQIYTREQLGKKQLKTVFLYL